MPTLAERFARGRQVLVIGVGVNAALAMFKLLCGWLGSSNALVADGLESTLDVLSSAMIWGALKYAGRPPDSDHPYGHGKMASLSGAGGALLLLIAGVLVAAGHAIAHQVKDTLLSEDLHLIDVTIHIEPA
jgi:cation diffusion facilitator family transporter